MDSEKTTPKAKPEKQIRKTMSIGNIYSKKFKTLELDGIWKDVLGEIEASGCWLVWGSDKNGKTRLAITLAKYLSGKHKVLYVSAEEGYSLNLQNICKWADISPKDRNFNLLDYEELKDLKERLRKRNAPQIVFIDNITFYHDELKYGGVRELMKEFSKTIFVFLAHEQKGEPYTSTAKMVNKLSSAIMYIKGLSCHVSGRVPGGTVVIDEEKAKLFHGQKIINQ